MESKLETPVGSLHCSDCGTSLVILGESKFGRVAIIGYCKLCGSRQLLSIDEYYMIKV